MTEQNKAELKIYISFDQLDKQLLNESIKKMSKYKIFFYYFFFLNNYNRITIKIILNNSEIRITPIAINEEIKLINSFAGDDQAKCVLKSINHVNG